MITYCLSILSHYNGITCAMRLKSQEAGMFGQQPIRANKNENINAKTLFEEKHRSSVVSLRKGSEMWKCFSFYDVFMYHFVSSPKLLLGELLSLLYTVVVLSNLRKIYVDCFCPSRNAFAKCHRVLLHLVKHSEKNIQTKYYQMFINFLRYNTNHRFV